METSSPRQNELLGVLFSRVSWATPGPKLKGCNTWIETTWVFECLWCPCGTFKKTTWWQRSQECCMAIRFTSSFGGSGGQPRLWSTGWMVFGKSRAKSMLFLSVVWCINLCWLVFRPRTDDNDWCRHVCRASNKAAERHFGMLSWRSGAIHCAPSIVLSLDGRPEGGADLVLLLGFSGYGMNTVLLRKSLVVDVCWGMP